MDNHSQMMTTRQLALYLRTSASTIRRMYRDGMFPVYHVRNQFRWNLGEVLAAIAQGPEQAGLTKSPESEMMERHGKNKTTGLGRVYPKAEGAPYDEIGNPIIDENEFGSSY